MSSRSCPLFPLSSNLLLLFPHAGTASFHLRQLYDKPDYCHGQNLKQNKAQESHNKERRIILMLRPGLSSSPLSLRVALGQWKAWQAAGMCGNE